MMSRLRRLLPHRPSLGGGASPLARVRAAFGGLGGRLGGAGAFLARSGRAIAARPPVLVGIAGLLILAVVSGTVLTMGAGGGNATASPAPSDLAYATDTLEPTDDATAEPTDDATAEPTDAATPTPEASPTFGPSPTPAPSTSFDPNTMVASTTSGIWLPADQSDVATRKPIAVMIDDHWGARPQSGLSYADIVYQGPAEGGIPRYMAIFQTKMPPAIGPIRSSREYFVAWAEEYRAIYVHMWGAPNAMARLAQDDKKYIFNVDGLRYGGKSGYMWRVAFRVAPHNLYSSYDRIWALGQKLGAKNPLATAPFTFGDALPGSDRPIGGTIAIAYSANTVTYVYDHDTNTYPRTVSAINSGSTRVAQVDAINQQRIAPSNVVLMTMQVGLAACTPASCHKHRLDVLYTGRGSAMVFNNGQAIPAIWTKKTKYSPTVITYRNGPNAGKPVPMVRGQIFVQVVPTYVPASWTTGNLPPPEMDPLDY